MIRTLISNKTRIKLLYKFFLNKQNKGYLRSLESELGGSTNAIRIELNRLESGGLLETTTSGNKKYYQANTNHPLFKEINHILQKTIGTDKICRTINKIEGVQSIFLTGDLAKGTESPLIDLILCGHKINKKEVSNNLCKLEKQLQKNIRFQIFTTEETEQFIRENITCKICTKH